MSDSAPPITQVWPAVSEAFPHAAPNAMDDLNSLSDAALSAELQHLRNEMVVLRREYAGLVAPGNKDVNASVGPGIFSSDGRSALKHAMGEWLPRTSGYIRFRQYANRYAPRLAGHSGAMREDPVRVDATERWKWIQRGLNEGISSVAARRAIVVLATILALLGQWLLATRPALVRLPIGVTQKLGPVWPDLAPALLAMMLFAIAMVLFGLGATRILRDPLVTWMDREVAAENSPASRLTWWSAGIGMLIWTYVIIRLAASSHEPVLARWYSAAIFLMLFGAIWAERKRIRAWRLPVASRPRVVLLLEIAYVIAAVGIFFWLSTFDLAHWRYANIDDEHAFYAVARDIANGADVNIFTQEGVYGYHPMLSSYFVGLQMRLLGDDIVAFKAATVVPAALALLLVYLLARTLFGPRVAVISLGLLTPAHCLLAFAHAGYYHLEAMFYASGALLFFVLGARYQSAT
ncbi:MAG: glycosyltransferase family 39 protein, partial [Chloroflexia bacterium]|nr:glycosyltransferase family 39 protein [Chloroflexia bacterium]